jgi:hypothetical protein
VTESNGHSEIVVQQVGEKQGFQEYQAYPIHTWDGSNHRSTGYMVATDSSLFYFDYAGDSPEQLLRLPLWPGRFWDRTDLEALSRYSDGGTDEFVTDEETTLPKDGETDGPTTDEGGDDTNPATLAPNVLAGVGTTTMQVQSIERVELSNGQLFGGVIRVVNTDASGRNNFYWFSPGTGLIKWSLGVEDRNLETASLTAELVEYGFSMP